MAEQRSISSRAWTEMTALAVIWGGSFLAVRIALDEIAFLGSVAHRVFWAALALWIVVWVRGLSVSRDPRIWGAFFVMGALNNAVPFSLMAWGQLHIESGLTAILNAATAIWGVLVAAIVFADERLTSRKVIGVVLGFLGVCTAIGLSALTSFDVRSLAQLAVIGGTVSYAVSAAWARATLASQPPLVAAAGMLTCSSVIMLPAAFAVEGGVPFDMSLRGWSAVGYYALVSTAIAYLLYYRVLAMVGSGNALLVTLMIAPVAIMLGALVRGEQLGLNAYAGFALLGLGLLILDGRLYNRFRKT